MSFDVYNTCSMEHYQIPQRLCYAPRSLSVTPKPASMYARDSSSRTRLPKVGFHTWEASALATYADLALACGRRISRSVTSHLLLPHAHFVCNLETEIRLPAYIIPNTDLA
jgi:hypothetical protein